MERESTSIYIKGIPSNGHTKEDTLIIQFVKKINQTLDSNFFCFFHFQDMVYFSMRK